MRIVVVGGTGHIGTWLVPRLVELGHEVVSLSRGERPPYQERGIWESVKRLRVDRDAEETAGTFGRRIADMSPDAVLDLICFTPESARHVVEALRDRTGHYLFCGTIWVHGPSATVPTTEEAPRRPFGEYGVRKAAIEAYLLEQAHHRSFPATILHPGHIVGPGWIPLNPQGNFNIGVYRTLARGERLPLPNLGLETVHHVHADDVAQAFTAALANRSSAVGESYHVVAASALSLRGYAEAVAAWFGRQANLEFLGWSEFEARAGKHDAGATWDHIAHSPHCSIDKARRHLGYNPRYTPLQATRESVDWLMASGELQI
jgi:nucleoside-diphosphate-sugar epimerase